MSDLPLCVDLDGTLILCDALYKSASGLLLRRPWLGFAMPFWLLNGRAAFKRKVAARFELDPSTLPYNLPFLAWLAAERDAGRRIILATASDQRIADPIAAYIGLFDEVLASDGSLNLKSANKLHRLQLQFGNEFEYAGNSSADIPIWEHCRSAVVVNAREPVLRKAREIGRVAKVFPRARNG